MFIRNVRFESLLTVFVRACHFNVFITKIIWLLDFDTRHGYPINSGILRCVYNLISIRRVHHRRDVNCLLRFCSCCLIWLIIDNFYWKNILIGKIDWHFLRLPLALWILIVCRCSHNHFIVWCLFWTFYWTLYHASLLLDMWGLFLLQIWLSNWIKFQVLWVHTLIHPLSQIDCLLFGMLRGLSSVWRLDWCLTWLSVEVIRVSLINFLIFTHIWLLSISNVYWVTVCSLTPSWTHMVSNLLSFFALKLTSGVWRVTLNHHLCRTFQLMIQQIILFGLVLNHYFNHVHCVLCVLKTVLLRLAFGRPQKLFPHFLLWASLHIAMQSLSRQCTI